MAITISGTGPLAGANVLPVDMAKFVQFKQYCYDQDMIYVWDGKCLNLGEYPPRFGDFQHGGAPCNGPDCSGFAQAILRYGAGVAAAGMPEGSYAQGVWFGSLGLKHSTPEDTLNSDGFLRVVVHHGDDLDPTGHVYFVLCKKGAPPHTVESYGGHGPGERAPDAMLRSGHRLIDLATKVFVVCQLPNGF